TLGELRAGAKVNLERSLRLGGRLDGHLVQGHVDGLAKVRDIDTAGQWLVRFAAGGELTDQMVAKGSVAVDGVSLTLVEVADGAFSVALIPETRRRTTLGALRVGARANVETDIIGKYVRKCAEAAAPEGLTMAKLREAGYV
ncbi:MAG TPA: riboflavin synthase, partial [Phycisphaerae bacterium]|nr:riboflavin synthase [Phycisphaerae bacterium]